MAPTSSVLRPLRTFILAGTTTLVGVSSACATTTEGTPPPAMASATTTDPEVVMLRERVARLERRLGEVDGTLAVLVARAEGTGSSGAMAAQRNATSPTSTSTSNAPPPRAWQPPPPPTPTPTAPVVDPLASIDLSRGTRASANDFGEIPLDRSYDNEFATSITNHSGDDGGDDGGDDTVVLRMHGDQVQVERGGEVGGIADASDPLSALGAKDLYTWAQARMKEGRHLEAITAFEDILARHGNSNLADNAQYWVGHCHQVRGDHHLALDVWQKLPANFPRSAKVPDALYGMAVSREALGEPALAEVLYDELVASYPKAEKRTAAKKALKRLRP